MKSQKIQPKTLSKSKQLLNVNNNKTNKEKNRPIKNSKKKIINKTSSSDIKQKKLNKSTKMFNSKINNINNEEEKNIRQSQETLNSKILSSEIDYSKNIISEKKVKNSIKRLIDTSQNLLEQQNNILLETDKLIQNIEVNEHEINKIEKKDNFSNFSGNINDYTENLDTVLSKLKKNTKDIDFFNKIKEENNNLKYKMQMLSIDKNDDYRNIETELNSIKTVYSNEMNGMLNFLNELGFENIPVEHMAPNILTSDKIINFFNLIKRTIKQLKDDNLEKEEQIKMINKYKENNNNKDIDNEQIIFNNTEYADKINNEYNTKYKTQNSFNPLNNKRLSQNNISKNLLSNTSCTSNNDRIKKIEDLCLQHNYEDDTNQKSEIDQRKTYEVNNVFLNNDENKKSHSYMDNFQRSKNMVNNESSTSGLGIQLEHNYTDSCFYNNMKDPYTNNNTNLDSINIMDKEYIPKIN